MDGHVSVMAVDMYVPRDGVSTGIRHVMGTSTSISHVIECLDNIVDPFIRPSSLWDEYYNGKTEVL